MLPIISGRHKTRFYASIILLPLFFLAISVLMMSGVATKRSGNSGAVFGAIVVCISVYFIYKYFKNVPVIKIDDRNISFNKTSFLLADIADIQLTGKHNFPFVGTFLMEAAMIQFNNGQTRLIYAQMYENSWQLRSYLQQVIIDKKAFTIQPQSAIQQAELDVEHFNSYKGVQLLTMQGIILWVCVAFFLFLALKAGMVPVYIFVAIFLSIIFYNLSWQMHYFKLSAGFLVVKNHNFFWKKDIYRLADIREVVLETRTKMPICLRVITNEYKDKLYPADTLYRKTWFLLKADLESKNIKVRDECL